MKKLKIEKTPNTNNGITLIALIITIIVMLILVAVTITMAVNGGLFEYASSAGTKTNAAIANEQELANLEDNMTVDELINKYTTSKDEEKTIITFTVGGTSYTAESGMTWEDWVLSDEYDSGTAYFNGSAISFNSSTCVLVKRVDSVYYNYVQKTDLIIDGQAYINDV